MHELPKARTQHVISERVDDERVVYDQTNQMAHCLKPGTRSV